MAKRKKRQSFLSGILGALPAAVGSVGSGNSILGSIGTAAAETVPPSILGGLASSTVAAVTAPKKDPTILGGLASQTAEIASTPPKNINEGIIDTVREEIPSLAVKGAIKGGLESIIEPFPEDYKKKDWNDPEFVQGRETANSRERRRRMGQFDLSMMTPLMLSTLLARQRRRRRGYSGTLLTGGSGAEENDILGGNKSLLGG